jgi:hypothetical protein
VMVATPIACNSSYLGDRAGGSGVQGQPGQKLARPYL